MSARPALSGVVAWDETRGVYLIACAARPAEVVPALPPVEIFPPQPWPRRLARRIRRVRDHLAWALHVVLRGRP